MVVEGSYTSVWVYRALVRVIRAFREDGRRPVDEFASGERVSVCWSPVPVGGVFRRRPGAFGRLSALVEKSHAPPRFRRDYPLNLSISVSGGKESNSDSLSSGERNGNSPAHNLPGYQACGEMLRQGNGR